MAAGSIAFNLLEFYKLFKLTSLGWVGQCSGRIDRVVGALVGLSDCLHKCKDNHSI